jgi:flagellar protein FlgJ
MALDRTSTLPTALSGGMSTQLSGASGLSLDTRSLDQLKATAGRDPKAATAAAARQLESLFMQELMKSMRASTMSSGMMDNSGSEMGTEMLDKEYASRMAGLPNGLSQAIERQLGRSMGVTTPAAPDAAALTLPGVAASSASISSTSTAALAQGLPLHREGMLPVAAAGSLAGSRAAARLSSELTLSTAALAARSAAAPAAAAAPGSAAGAVATGSTTGASATAASAEAEVKPHLRPAQAFVRQHLDAARQIEAETGIPAAHLIGQAAHETGWGRHQIRMKDGSSSHNLFGIKAGAGWTGKVAEVTTTEYINGVPRKVTARFRAYDSAEDAFRDHARLLTQNQRYAGAVANADDARRYAQGLQRGGYATDPAYADKLARVINTAARLQRGLA